MQGLHWGATKGDAVQPGGLRGLAVPYRTPAQRRQGPTNTVAGAAGLLLVVLQRVGQGGPVVPRLAVQPLAVADGPGDGRDPAR